MLRNNFHNDAVSNYKFVTGTSSCIFHEPACNYSLPSVEGVGAEHVRSLYVGATSFAAAKSDRIE